MRIRSLSKAFAGTVIRDFTIQSNSDGSNIFGTMKICSRQRLFEPRKVTIGAIPGGIMEIIVGYIFGVLYFKCMSCVLVHTAYIYKMKKISLNYPYIVIGGNPSGLENLFDSSMVNEPSGFEPLGFEPLKFYCISTDSKLQMSARGLSGLSMSLMPRKHISVWRCSRITQCSENVLTMMPRIWLHSLLISLGLLLPALKLSRRKECLDEQHRHLWMCGWI